MPRVVHSRFSCFSEKTETIYIDASKPLLLRIFDHGHELAHLVLHKLGLPLRFHLAYDHLCPQGLHGRFRRPPSANKG